MSLNEEFAALKVIQAGICCNAFNLLVRLGILEKSRREGYKCPENPTADQELAVASAFLSLEALGIVERKQGSYFLTRLGESLYERRGLIELLFEGYGQLMAQGSELLCKPVEERLQYLNGPAISRSSIQFGEDTVDPVLLDLLKKLNPRKSICDLGCGSGARLIKICSELGIEGLGIELENQVVKDAIRNVEDYPGIYIERGDICNLEGVWSEVEILMQCFVMHDIASEEQCLKLMDSYLDNFPNLHHFIWVDIVAPDDPSYEIMPGFDYVHGLIGTPTRKFGELTQLFDGSGYTVTQKIKIDSLPSAYIWVLSTEKALGRSKKQQITLSR